MNEFITYLKQQQYTSKSIVTRKRTVRLYLEWVSRERLEPEQVSYQDLLGYMRHCNKTGKTQKTIQHYLSSIKLFYDHLEEQRKITINPVLGIEVKGVKRKVLYHILEPHELHALYNDYPTKTLTDRRNKAMLGLMLYQGIKTEELARMTTKDIKLREGQIDVLGTRKSNGRLLQLESHQVMEMYDYMLQVRPQLLKMKPKRKSQTRIETAQLFIGEGGQCYSMSNFVTRLMVRVRRINPAVKNAKQIRASVITKWVKMHNLRKAQYLAGHRYISTTESYLENDMEGLKEEVQQYHPLG